MSAVSYDCWFDIENPVKTETDAFTLWHIMLISRKTITVYGEITFFLLDFLSYALIVIHFYSVMFACVHFYFLFLELDLVCYA